MKDYQQRVHDEFSELRQKVVGLGKYLQAGQQSICSDFEWDALNRQLIFMTGYLGVLQERVESYMFDGGCDA